MNKEEQDKDMKVKRSLGYSNHKTVKLNISREVSKKNNRSWTYENRVQFVQGSALQNPMGDCSVGPRSP